MPPDPIRVQLGAAGGDVNPASSIPAASGRLRPASRYGMALVLPGGGPPSPLISHLLNYQPKRQAKPLLKK